MKKTTLKLDRFLARVSASRQNIYHHHTHALSLKIVQKSIMLI